MHTCNIQVYDGTSSATINDNSLTLVGVVAGDYVTLFPVPAFDDANVGIGKSVSLTGASSLGGIDASNYTLSLVGAPTTTADIIASELTVSVNAPDKVSEDVDFTVTMDITEVAELNAAQYDIWFDPAVLRLDNITDGIIDTTPFPIPTGDIAPQEIAPGHWRIVQSMGLSSVMGNGYLAALHFHIVGELGDTSSIDITDGVLSGMAGEILAT